MSSLLLKESISNYRYLSLGFLKHSSCHTAGSPKGQMEFKGTNIMVFRVNLFVIKRKENTWVGSGI